MKTRPFPYAHLLPKRRRPQKQVDPQQLAALKRQALAKLGIQPNQPRQLVENPELTIALRRMRYFQALRQGDEVW